MVERVGFEFSSLLKTKELSGANRPCKVLKRKQRNSYCPLDCPFEVPYPFRWTRLTTAGSCWGKMVSDKKLAPTLTFDRSTIAPASVVLFGARARRRHSMLCWHAKCEKLQCSWSRHCTRQTIMPGSDFDTPL